MLALELSDVEKILNRLEELEYPFSQYKFNKVENQYQIIGKGGFATVYDMIDCEYPERHYAMKVIRPECQGMSMIEFWNTYRIQRALCESSSYIMRALAARSLLVTLDEEGTVKEVQDVAEGEESRNEDGIIFQFILVEKLEDILANDKFRNMRLVRKEMHEQKEVLKFAIQIGQALELAHKNNVLHRDIKLENIFWDAKASSYKLGDFGIAKYAETGNAETVVYTDGYGAPEIEKRLNNNYNATADIYSFGITLYLLLNKLRFPGSEGYYVNMVQYDPEFTFPAPEDASELMTHVIRKMCNYRRENRYQTMAEILMDLRQLNDSLGKTEYEEQAEYGDLPTETFKEEKDELAIEIDNNRKGEIQAPLDEDCGNMSRARRIKEQKLLDKHYGKSSAWYLVAFSLLFVLLFGGLQSDVSFAMRWQFLILPVAVLVESILLRIKEFHIVFGIIALLIGAYSISVVGLTVPHVFLTLCILISVPSVTAGGAIGTGLWMLLIFTHKISWLNFICEYDFCWMLLVVIIVLLHRILKLRMDASKTTILRVFIGTYIYDKLALLMLVAGIVILGLQHFEVLLIPDVMKHIHLIRTGIIVYLVYAFSLWWDGDLDDEVEAAEDNGDEAIDDEYMDK